MNPRGGCSRPALTSRTPRAVFREGAHPALFFEHLIGRPVSARGDGFALAEDFGQALDLAGMADRKGCWRYSWAAAARKRSRGRERVG